MFLRIYLLQLTVRFFLSDCSFYLLRALSFAFGLWHSIWLFSLLFSIVKNDMYTIVYETHIMSVCVCVFVFLLSSVDYDRMCTVCMGVL